MKSLVEQGYFPRLPSRGPIEAEFVLLRFTEANVTFRDFQVAAPLKLRLDGHLCKVVSAFRDFQVAAPLKRCRNLYEYDHCGLSATSKSRPH